MRTPLLVLFFLMAFVSSNAQTDTAFWFAVPEASSGHGDGPIYLRVTSQSTAANIKVYVPANTGVTPINVSIAANSVSTIDLTSLKASLENDVANTVLNRGLKIESSAQITAYFEQASSNNPEIFALKGKNANGTLFYVPGQTSMSNGTYTPTPYNSFDIVATEDNTVVTITPKKDIVGHAAGIPFTVTLNKGQTYSAWATTTNAAGHLGGSKISASKAVAVTFKDDSVILGSCRDLGGDQIVPVEMLGQEYIAIQGYLTTGNDIASIMAVQNNTTVTIDGTQTITLNEGESYEKTFSNNPIIIKSNKPISVLHITGSGCELGYAMLPQIGCNGSNSIGITRPGDKTFRLFLLCEEGTQGGFALNGNTSFIGANDFRNLTGNWRYARVTLTTAQLASGASALITNSSGKFHLGILYGNESDGLSYGYFSNYASANSSISYNSPVCVGGTIQFTTDPGTTSTGLVYEWSGPDGFSSTLQNPSIANATAAKSGKYFCKITNQGCFVTLLSIDVVVNSYPTASISSNGPVCANGTVQLTGSSDMSDANFSWTGPNSYASTGTTVNIANATVAASGLYTLTVTKNGCATIATNTYTVKPNPAATISGSTAVCTGSALSLNVPTTAGATYAWSGPNGYSATAASFTINNYAATHVGNYAITVTHNGCTSSSSVTTTIKSLPVAQINGVNSICENGTLSLNATDAGTGSSYAWVGPNSFSSNSSNFSINTAALTNGGSYSLTVTKDGCVSTVSQAVTIKPLPVAQINGSNSICENGILSLNATDAGMGSSYAWVGPNSFSSNSSNISINNLASIHGGSYNLTVTKDGCVSATSQAVTVKPLPVAQINGVSSICETGTLSLNATDAGSGASYAWVGPNSFNSNNSNISINNLASIHGGLYNLTVTKDGCVSTTTQSVTVKALPVAQINGSNSICENGTLLLNATDAGTGSSYVWVGPNSFSSNSSNISINNLASIHGGSYSLTVTKDGCVSTTSQAVTVKLLPVAQINGSNNICENGTLSLNATDAGTGSSYAWVGPNSFSSNSSNISINGLSLANGGSYSLTVTKDGCVSTASQAVTIKPLPVAQINGANSICENATLALNATDAGTGATYAWAGPNSYSANSSNISINNLASIHGGSYSLTVTKDGCVSTTSQAVTVKLLPVAQINGSNNICENGTLSLNATDAGSGASYAWVGPNSFSSNSSNISINDLSFANGGSYSLTVTKDGCNSTISQSVTVKALPVAQINGVSSICETGTLSLNATDAGTGASYAWVGPNSFSANSSNINISSVANINAGSYSLTVTKDGCISTTSQSVTVKVLPVAQINGSNSICENGTLSLNATDAGTGSSYAWVGPNSFSSNSSNISINNLASIHGGSYGLTVTKDGCISTTSQSVTVKTLPVAQVNGVNSICENGTLSLNATDAGTGATYAWVGPNSFSSNSSNININSIANINAGSYSLTVTKDGCLSTTSQSVIVKALPVAQINGSNSICENATLALSATDAGTGASYVWAGPNSYSSNSSNININSVANINAGSYSLTVMKDGCISTTSQSVTVKALPLAQINGSNSICENGTLSLNATDAGTGASYAWVGPNSFSSNSSNISINNLASIHGGSYSLTVTKDGCVSTTSQSVTVKTLPVAQINGSNSICENGTLALNATDAGTGSSYAWVGPNSFSSNSSNISINNLASIHGGSYSLTVTKDGCVSGTSQAVTVKLLPVAQINGANSICENGTLSLNATDAGTGASYAWVGPNSFSANSSNININTAALANGGTYSLIVTKDGCSASSAKVVAVKPLPVATIAAAAKICENDDLVMKAIAVSSIDSYQWTTPSGKTFSQSQIHLGKADLNDEGTYQLSITLDGCSTTVTAPLKVTALPTAKISGASDVCENSVIDLKATANNTGINFAWVDPAGNVIAQPAIVINNASVANAGIYQLKMTQDGCSNTAAVNMKVRPLPKIKVSGKLSVCEKDDLKVTAEKDPAISYTWSRANQTLSTDNTLSINNILAEQAGKYTITATKEGCVTNTNVHIQVRTVSATITGKKELCATDDLQLSAEDEGNTAKYEWSGPSFKANEREISIKGIKEQQEGIYHLTVIKEGCTAYDSILVKVRSLPAAEIVGQTVICEGASLSLNAKGAGDNATYRWKYASGEASSNNLQISKATMNIAGQYMLTVFSNGCENTTTTTVKVNALPNAKIMGDAAVCEGLSLQLLAADAGEGAVYSWSLPGDEHVSGTSLKIAPVQLTHSGLYKLEVNKDGCSSVIEKDLVVKKKPLAVVYGNTDICENTALQLTAGEAGVGASYQWALPNGNVINGRELKLENINKNGSGDHVLTIMKDGCIEKTAAKVFVKPVPVATIVQATAVCEGETLVIKAASDIAGTMFEWNGPKTVSVVGESLTIPNANAQHTGVYQVIARANGCEATYSQAIKVKALPRPIITGTEAICEGSDIVLYSKDAGATGVFTWSTPEGKQFTTQNINISKAALSAAGIYKLKVEFDGCTAYDSLIVKVNKMPVISLAQAEEVCQFTPSFYVKASELSGTKGKGIFSGAIISASGEVNTTRSGEHAISYVYTANNGCSVTANSMIKIRPGVSVNAGNDLVQYEEEGVQLKAMISSSYKQLTWSNIQGAEANNISPVVKPQTTTTYTITVVNEYGCSAKDDVTVKVVRMKIPNAFSPNNDGINDKWVVEALRNYPSSTVDIFDRSGRSVHTSKGSDVSWDATLNGQPLPAGTYYYIINVNDKERKPISGWLQVIR